MFFLYKESFHHFKPVYFKVFEDSSTTPFWETLERELQFNYYWCKHFDAPRIDEDTLRIEDQAVIHFFLQTFGKNHLNLKNIVGVKVEVARRYLGFPFPLTTCIPFSSFGY